MKHQAGQKHPEKAGFGDALKQRLAGFFRDMRETFSSELLKVLLFILVLGFFSAALVFWFENTVNQGFKTIEDAIWWAFVTLTTTGYGDIYPITTPGRMVTVVVVLAGVVTLSILSGVVSSILVARKIKEDRGLQEVKLKGHILICGWNHNAEKILSLFRDSGSSKNKFVLINELPESQISNVIYAFKSLEIKFVSGKFINEEVLQRANAKLAEAAIILADFSSADSAKVDERTLLATLTLKSINPKLKVCAHIVHPANRAPLQRANADAIVLSDQHVGYYLVNHVISPGIPEAIDNLFDYKTGSQFQKTAIPPEFKGRSFGELFQYFRQHQQAILIGVITEEKGLSVDDILSSESSSYLDEFIRQKFAESGKQVGQKRSVVMLNPSDDYVILDTDSALTIASK
ncbi:Ion transport 2 domain protein [Chloroherpeton thalassium ATCC 35110]|uniref:Ion transport 2 domain protein n=1 Tax=Chloroherpeton thalassium (strain ATCC 35110 / GB-78) TaxID=517418 RepID=B3QZ69_CHLT3|nr:ion channel [Chloroherpeton thalassium]ACF13762.1 Ion transport 2 domain protein [Chloroherpeton thalassium ATCC 35110]